MNKPIKHSLAKLLKEKGYNKHGYLQDVWLGNKYEWKGKGKNKKSVEIPVFGLGSSSVLPTISDVVMWLYEKHGIWIAVDWMTRTKPYKSGFYSNLRGTTKPLNQDNFISINNTKSPGYEVFNSPTEAYEAAIEYTLKNLI